MLRFLDSITTDAHRDRVCSSVLLGKLKLKLTNMMRWMMVGRFVLSWIFCYCCFAPAVVASHQQNFNGVNVRVLLLEVKPFVIAVRNSTDNSGSILHASGVAYSQLEWLARSLNFTISFIDDFMVSMTDTPGKRGALSYLQNKEVDMLLGPATINQKRLSLMDFPYPSLVTHLSLLIPMPEKTVNGVSAVWQPLQPQVWWCLFFCLAFAWAFTRSAFKDRSTYIWQVLLYQGGGYRRSTVTARLAEGAWCLACFVVANAYCSVLVSFLTAPVYQSLVNSVHELSNKTYIHPVIERNKAADILLQSTDTGVGKFLLNIVNKDPLNRCDLEEGCLDKVRYNSSVYIQLTDFALDQIGREYKRTGHCDLSILHETFLNFLGGMALAKDSSFTTSFSTELMKMEAAGMFGLWWRMNRADPTRCLEEARAQPNSPKLKLKGLSGAFVVLGVGAALSFLAFLFERIAFRL